MTEITRETLVNAKLEVVDENGAKTGEVVTVLMISLGLLEEGFDAVDIVRLTLKGNEAKTEVVG